MTTEDIRGYVQDNHDVVLSDKEATYILRYLDFAELYRQVDVSVGWILKMRAEDSGRIHEQTTQTIEGMV